MKFMKFSRMVELGVHQRALAAAGMYVEESRAFLKTIELRDALRDVGDISDTEERSLSLAISSIQQVLLMRPSLRIYRAHCERSNDGSERRERQAGSVESE